MCEKQNTCFLENIVFFKYINISWYLIIPIFVRTIFIPLRENLNELLQVQFYKRDGL